MRKGCLSCLVLAALVACSSDKPKSKPAELTDFDPKVRVEVRWKAGIGGAGESVLYPAVTREAVFAADADGKVYRFDRNTGQRVWRVDAGFPVAGGVGAGEGLVLVGGEKGELAAFEEESGRLRWLTRMPSDVLSPPKVADGVVVVRTGNQRLIGVNAKDGSRLWLYERATPALVVRSHAGVLIRDGLVYAGFAAGKLAAINLRNGVVVWEASVSQPRGNTEIERISDITSLPVIDDSQVCAVAFQGRLACFDAARGGMLWTRDIASDKGLTLEGGTLYVTDTDSNLYALDKSSGASLWKNSQLYLRNGTAVYALDDYLLLGDFEGYLHVLKREDGSLVGRIRMDRSAIRIAPVMLGEGALVQTSKGGLYFVVLR